ncbi:MAG: 5-bromo-4-chloroindolyl phosphate hydrolysis family protein [Clostridia bacterium]|nr:5-bromo-4-chloroindolyl phosphate hydrolysis family protein [Clostridia bacterium]
MKKVHLRSAIPIYIAAAVWLLMGLILPKALMKLPGFLIAVALSAAGYVVGSKVFPGRDITVEEKIETGDAKLDRDIADGRARLEKLREANAAIDHPGITANLNRMTKAGEQIFKELGRDPKKVQLVRRFMNYYLPTAEKLMEQYRQLSATKVRGENIQSAMGRIESSMGIIADAFDKCADNLFKDEEMDIDAEIQVMKTMLTGDSLTDSPLNDIRKAANQAATPPQATEQDSGEREIKLTLGGH